MSYSRYLTSAIMYSKYGTRILKKYTELSDIPREATYIYQSL